MESSRLTGVVTRSVSGFYYVDCAGRSYECFAPKGMRHKGFDEPVAGDRVAFVADLEGKHRITTVLPRKNYFFRPKIANVTTAVVVQSLKSPDLSTYLLDKYVAFFEARTVERVLIVFTKASLLGGAALVEATKVMAGYARDGYAVFDAEKDVAGLKALLREGLAVFAGQTGAGKSTLANRVDPAYARFIQAVSTRRDGGRHTTTEIRLLKHDGGYIADTPGFSSLELRLTPLELANAFHDFARLSRRCKFNNCLHLGEAGCAVKQAYNHGDFSPWRYENYVRLAREVAGGDG